MENTNNEKLERAQAAAKAEKEINPEDKIGIVKFLPPETPEEFYDRAQSYLKGAACCVPFQEKANYLKKAAEMFTGAGDYQDAPAKAAEAAAEAEETLKTGYAKAYAEACEMRKNAKTEQDYFKTARAFERILDYKDAQKQADEVERKLRRIHARAIPIALSIIALVVALITGCVIGARTSAFRYQLGHVFSAVGIDSVSTLLFESAGDYSDAPDQLEQCHYRQGAKALRRNDYSSAVSHFAKLSQPLNDSDELRYEAERQMLKTTHVGQEIHFGAQKWLVLEQGEGRLLLVARNPLDQKKFSSCYDVDCDAASWEESDLCTYLNDTYAGTVFSGAEWAVVEQETGVFMLSVEEFNLYEDILNDEELRSKTSWWLRDMGAVPGTAAYTAWDGKVDAAGTAMSSEVVRIRPAVWIDVEQ